MADSSCFNLSTCVRLLPSHMPCFWRLGLPRRTKGGVKIEDKKKTRADGSVHGKQVRLCCLPAPELLWIMLMAFGLCGRTTVEVSFSLGLSVQLVSAFCGSSPVSGVTCTSTSASDMDWWVSCAKMPVFGNAFARTGVGQVQPHSPNVCCSAVTYGTGKKVCCTMNLTKLSIPIRPASYWPSAALG